MISWIRSNSLFIALLFLITLYTFWGITNVFYQQDEWKVLGEYFAMESFWEIFNRVDLFKAILGEGRIFSLIAGFFLLKNFPFETWPLAIYSLLFHFVNSLLVFQLGNKLIGNKIYALLSAVFFIVCAVSSSTVFWYGTSIGTLPATTLILLSVLFFWNGISGNRRSLIISFVLLFLSQLFKEIGYVFFFILPISVFLYQKINVKHFLKTYWYFLATFFLITIYRLTQLNSYSNESAVFIQTGSHNFFLTIASRLFLYPFTSSSLIFFPSEFLLNVAKIFTNHYYPFFPSEHYNSIVESVVLDFIATSISFLLVLIFIAISIKVTKQIRKNTLFTALLLLTSFLPYVILSKTYAYLDSRYYYLGAAFAGILFGFLVNNLSYVSKRKLFTFFLLLVAFFYLLWQSQVTKFNLEKLIILSSERKSILNQLSSIKPSLEGKNIFLVFGDRHYYLAHDNFVPFQQGFGHTILVWLNRDKDTFKQFFKSGELWELGSQGYLENGNNGFGYFWDKDLAVKTLKERKLPEASLVILYYDSKSGKLSRINDR